MPSIESILIGSPQSGKAQANQVGQGKSLERWSVVVVVVVIVMVVVTTSSSSSVFTTMLLLTGYREPYY